MISKPASMDECRTAIAATIQRLNSISSQQFFDESTLQYDADCAALDWIGGALVLDIEDWKRFMATNSPGRGTWLPPKEADLRAMSAVEIYYRLRENIAGENWVDGALVDAFEAGVLANALERLLLGLNDGELQLS